jgi:hypothetical protein
MMNRETITRRRLPHWYVPGAPHFVTFRLAGTLPRTVLDKLKRQKDEMLQRKSLKREHLQADPDNAELGETEDSLGPLSNIMHSLKSYTAHEANLILDRDGSFWQRESYDHWVRDEDELERIVHYIDDNAVAAKLAPRPHDWYFCSAHDRYLGEGATGGWLNLPTS